MITIYLPTHNRRNILARAVESVMAQDYKDFDLIIVNDASSDDTNEFLISAALRDKRLRILTNHTPLGACKSRNRAILSSSAEFVTGLDDDDLFRPNHLSTLVDEYERRSVTSRPTAVYPQIVTRTGTGEKVCKHQKPVATPSDLLISNCVGNQVLCKRSTLVEAGAFDEEMPAWQDYETWMRLARIVGRLYCTNKPTYVQDESHLFERTTHKKFQSIRLAYQRCLDLHLADATVEERLRFRVNYHSYPQVPMSVIELVEYFRHGLLLKPAYHFARKKATGLMRAG